MGLPRDLSYVIKGTNDQIRRLGWTVEQVKEHLLKTYGKRARTLLNEQELVSFLTYLKSQP